MQSVLSRIWTRVAVSISCDDNHYTTMLYTLLVNNNGYVIVPILLNIFDTIVRAGTLAD